MLKFIYFIRGSDRRTNERPKITSYLNNLVGLPPIQSINPSTLVELISSLISGDQKQVKQKQIRDQREENKY